MCVIDPNHFKLQGGHGIAIEKPKCAAFVGMAEVVRPEMTMFVESNPNKPKMSEFDQKYAQDCINKHGSNYTTMFRDTKLNYFQKTENQLKKMCEKLLSLDDSERF